jgi:hypothetical protein
LLAYLHPADEGLYTCRAANGHGEDVRSVRLHVKVKSVKKYFYKTEVFKSDRQILHRRY